METNFSEAPRSAVAARHHDALERIRDHLARQLEEALGKALDGLLGPGWKLEDLQGRLRHVHRAGEEASTYYLDGTPLINVWPSKLETARFGMNHATQLDVSQRIEVLVPLN